jgi:uncharacterized protein
MLKPTLIIGASITTGKRSNNMVKKLVAKGYTVYPLGRDEGEIAGVKVLTGFPEISDVHTVIMYLKTEKQLQYHDYILKLNPKRIIFNSKTENDDLRKLARAQGIETLYACSLVMIGMDEY